MTNIHRIMGLKTPGQRLTLELKREPITVTKRTVEVTKDHRLDFIKSMITNLSMNHNKCTTAEQHEELQIRLAKLTASYYIIKNQEK